MDEIKRQEAEDGGSSDDLLVERFKNGDRAAFDELYNKYKARMLNYLHRFLGDREAAEDLAQETFIQVYVNIKGYRPVGMFKSWLYKIASNIAKNEHRKRAHRKEASLYAELADGGGLTLADILSDEKLSPERIAQNEELKGQIEKILEAIPPVYREAMILCVIEGLSYEEAAETLKTNVKTVSSRLARARELFIGHLKKTRGSELR